MDLVSLALDRIARSVACEQMSFRDYVPAAWPLIEPTTALLPNWHIDCIAEHLEAVTIGQIQFLIINLPPRHLKSDLASKLWPTWSWTQRPGLRWVFLSYAQHLAENFSKDRRDIIESEWYRSRWGSIVQIESDQNQKREFMNTARGVMTATSVGGTLTGKGADIILIDDGIDPQRANSKAEREASIRFVKNTVATRLNDKRTGAIVEISQRTHKQDISGTLLAEGMYVHLNLPAMAEKKITVVFPISKREIVREVGDALHPEREDKAILARQKTQMTIHGKSAQSFEAQYQQNPSSDEGGMWKRAYWKFYQVPPRIIWRVWTWDTAMEKGQENDYTVGMLLCFHGQGVCVERVVRDRMQYPELKETVSMEWQARPANELLIEDKVSGKSLQQDLRKSTDFPVRAVKVDGDKVFRAGLASPYAASGRISLKEGALWVPEFIEEFADFPFGEFDDQVDSLSQGINQYYQTMQAPAAALVGGGVAMPPSVDHNGSANGSKNGTGLIRPDWM